MFVIYINNRNRTLVYSKVNSLSHLQFLVKVLENKQKNVIQTLSRDANIFFGVEILGNSTRLTSDLEMFLTTEGFLLFFWQNISTYINVFVQKFKSNSKTSTSTGILFWFYYFLIKFYLKVLLRMRGLYWSLHLTQTVTTNPDFVKD